MVFRPGCSQESAVYDSGRPGVRSAFARLLFHASHSARYAAVSRRTAVTCPVRSRVVRSATADSPTAINTAAGTMRRRARDGSSVDMLSPISEWTKKMPARFMREAGRRDEAYDYAWIINPRRTCADSRSALQRRSAYRDTRT